jgi:ectoine hydroxylase-related dioxygenase (phytanoyl-CoA dioxygenase family)
MGHTGSTRSLALAPAARRRFFDEGLILLRGVFDADEVARMRRAFERLETRAARLEETAEVEGSSFVLERSANRPVRIHRVVWCAAAEPALGRFGEDPRLTGVAARLLGSPKIVQLINQAHFKLPGDGVAFPWHQDSRHRRYGEDTWTDVNGRGSFVQTVTAIDPVVPENGPLEWIPKSCRLGHVDAQGRGERIARELIRETPGRMALMQPGDVAFFGPYTFHRSRPNLSAGPRRVLINGYAYPGANSRVYPGCGRGRELRPIRMARWI